MVPFVAAGGLLIALGFVFGGSPTIDGAPSRLDRQHPGPASRAGFDPASAAGCAGCCSRSAASPSASSCPVLAGYIAYGMADRPGLVPGFVGGLIAGHRSAPASSAAWSPVSLAGGVALVDPDPLEGPDRAARHHAGRGDPADLLAASSAS